jgi:hypothetical protein
VCLDSTIGLRLSHNLRPYSNFMVEDVECVIYSKNLRSRRSFSKAFSLSANADIDHH